jgi:hypothetical protein
MYPVLGQHKSTWMRAPTEFMEGLSLYLAEVSRITSKFSSRLALKSNHSSSKAGDNAERPNLCGGCWVTGSPTAMAARPSLKEVL